MSATTGRWVRKDISGQIGKRFGQLTIEARSEKTDSARSLFVRCSCDCGKQFDARLSHIVAGRVVSCGHVRSERFKKHWDDRAQKLPASWTRYIFVELCQRYKHSAELAKRLCMKKPLVDAAFRVHATRLLETYALTRDDVSNGPFRGMRKFTARARQYRLTLPEFMWLRRQWYRSLEPDNLSLSAEEADGAWTWPDLAAA